MFLPMDKVNVYRFALGTGEQLRNDGLNTLNTLEDPSALMKEICRL